MLREISIVWYCKSVKFNQTLIKLDLILSKNWTTLSPIPNFVKRFFEGWAKHHGTAMFLKVVPQT